MSNNVISVSGLTKYIKSLLESDVRLSSFTVTGEISNLTIHRTGHLYFDIKDEGAVISAVMFRGSASALKFKPENGMKILAKGKISLFEPSGRYQVMVTSMEPDGIGDLYVAYELLKKKLEKEGLFSDSHKNRLPKIPHTVGIVTSPTGAAIRDILNVLNRRFPYSNVILYPSLVQGEGAPKQLIRALEYFEQSKCADVVIIGRGGGSIEDLWAFNDESLARYIYGMSVPVVSAVGHEIDFTICDFVSDKRAPTPSAAAEIVVPETEDMVLKFDNVVKRLKLILKRKTEFCSQQLKNLSEKKVLTDPSFIIDNRQMLVDYNFEKLCNTVDGRIFNFASSLEKYSAKLDALSPLKIISRGYLFAKNDLGTIVKSIDDMYVGSTIHLNLCDGTADCTVDVIKGENNGK